MITKIIAASLAHRAIVLLFAIILAALGIWAVQHIRLDAIPDLSDVQVIVVTEFPGQNPEVVDKQVTYPLASALLSVPGAADVRGFSMFELSFVYVLFEDNTDIYWARSRVLESLSFVRDRLPEGVQPVLGPDATGLGWVYQYALVPGFYCPDHPRVRGFESSGSCPTDGKPLVPANIDLAEMRSLQDWYLRFPLTAVHGVAEVATIGGFVKQYQVVLDPRKLQAYRVSLNEIVSALQRSNQDVGGSVVEISENEYMVRSRGYLAGVEDVRRVPVGLGESGTPIFLEDVATIQVGGEARRGIGELDGVGEAVGAVVISRFGENAFQVIHDVKEKLADLESGLPPGVFVKTTYDRSALIDRSVDTLREAVLQELIIVALVCFLFLSHVRSALVALVVLPIGLLVSILIMNLLGINANIMSLGGLALAIGIMVDSSIVMIENVHKWTEREEDAVARGRPPRSRMAIVLGATSEVGPALFFSLLIITVSFLPIFVLGEQSGRLFKPLAYTKTFALAAAALLSITVIPVLVAMFVRGKIPREESNPLNRWMMSAYEPFFARVMRRPRTTLFVVVLLGLSTLYPISRLGSEFMPAFDEGDLLYMPTTDPSIGVTKAKELLQQTDRLIKSFPEVATVHGKIGRAETATDPAPLSMIETVVRLEPDRSKWRTREVDRFFSGWPGILKWPFTTTFWPERRTITTDELKFGWTEGAVHHPGLNDALNFPGIANAWPYPIENRINMLSTGIKTPVGIKILGPDLAVLSELAEKSATVVRTIPGTLSSYAERTMGGYYLDVEVDRAGAARYGLTVGDVQDVVRTAIGGVSVTTTVEGLGRFPLNVRYARELRDDLPRLSDVLVDTPTGNPIPLGQVASFKISPGPPMIRSENAQTTAWVYVDIAGRDLGGFVKEAREAVEREVPLPPGYSRIWSGRFESLEKANERLRVVVPITLAIIVLLLYAANRSWTRVFIVLLAVPFSLIGAFWFMYALGYDMSLAVWVGIIGLLGIDAETGQVMLLYLDQAVRRAKEEGRLRTVSDLYAAIHEGAVRRIRPKLMTVATDFVGLLPLLWVTGTGAEITRRLVAPLVGGILVSFLMELLVYPVVFFLIRRRGLAPDGANGRRPHFTSE
jgi:Cu(I)/Ag(I) efflux system membrane protein CusA/SilA